MDCLEFRRRCLTEHNYKGREFLFHENDCEKCARFVVQTKALEVHLADAIRIDVPENLAERVKMEHRVLTSDRKRGQVIALAASILITLAN